MILSVHQMSKSFASIFRRLVTTCKRSVEDAITPCLTESGIEPNQWTLEGSMPTRKNFIVRFMLNPISAGRFAKDALGNREDENGVYKVFNAKLVNGQIEKLHIGPDESPKARTSRAGTADRGPSHRARPSARSAP